RLGGAIGIVAEAEARPDVDPAVVLPGILRIAKRSEVELHVEEAIEVVEGGWKPRIDGPRHHVRVEVVARPDIDDQLGRQPPVILGEHPPLVAITVVEVWPEGDIDSTGYICE